MHALTDWRSLVFLIIGLVAAIGLSIPPLALIGIGSYLWVGKKLAESPAFQASILEAETRADFMKQLSELVVLVNETRTAATTRILSIVTSLIDEYHREKYSNDDPQHLLVNQALKLGKIYLRIARSQKVISAKGSNEGVRIYIAGRLEKNLKKLERLKDPMAKRDVERAINDDLLELDRLDRDLGTIELADAKLISLESMMDRIQRRFLNLGAEEDVSTSVDQVLVEAEALDSALEEVYNSPRTRQKVR